VSVEPATLGTESDWASRATVMGWGETATSIQSDALLAADLPTFTDSECLASFGAQYDSATMLCAGEATNNRACFGDSGGPLMVTYDKGATWKLIGIVSFVALSCQEKPGAFAWVAGPALRPWVVAAISPPPALRAPTPPPPPAPQRAIVAPAPPVQAVANLRVLAMSQGAAVGDLRRLIGRKTHHAARHLFVRCRRLSLFSFSCTATFSAAERHYHGRFRVRQYKDHNITRWRGVFIGVRSDGRRVEWRG
jgi:hypothetical protein